MIKNIEILEKEINELGSTWNLFGKVDRIKFLLKKIKEEVLKKVILTYENLK